MYEIIKTLHILFVMGWLACVFVLPRVMIYWSKEVTDSIEFSSFKSLAVGLFRFGSLMAILGIVCGVALWLNYGYFGNWLLYKILLVMLLIIYHITNGLYLLGVINKRVFKSALFLRIFNESSLLLVVPIIYLAVSKAIWHDQQYPFYSPPRWMCEVHLLNKKIKVENFVFTLMIVF